MSALGQKQTFAVQNVMSALPPKADIHQMADVRRIVAYLASMAVTSTSIIIYGQASWGTFSSVDAGMGASPNASLRHFNAS
jgi:hypothetical protein